VSDGRKIMGRGNKGGEEEIPESLRRKRTRPEKKKRKEGGEGGKIPGRHTPRRRGVAHFSGAGHESQHSLQFVIGEKTALFAREQKKSPCARVAAEGKMRNPKGEKKSWGCSYLG